ncbi:MAG: hypothetical protein IJT54_03695 [Candidatus Methanomethylophilaceae archaeon]|nr:hypothetical protein [Candidatus Methanomethylophilaceae archaeon]
MPIKKVKDHRGVEYSIPVGKDGYVPMEALYERRKEVQTQRGRVMDLRKASKRIYPANMVPEDAVVWWSDPRKCDIEGIDTLEKANVVLPPREVKYKEYKEPSELRQRALEDEYIRSIGDDEMDEDKLSYLIDSRYDEVMSNSRWTYDPRTTSAAYRAKMWDEMKMQSYKKKAKSQIQKIKQFFNKRATA